MLKYCFCFLFFLGSIDAFSQSSDHALSISFGPSFSVGRFGSNDFNDELSGNAKIGLSAELSYLISRENHFGWEVMLYGQQNFIDNKTLSKQQNDLFSEPFGTSSGGEPIYFDNWNFRRNKWSVLALMTGINFTIPINSDHILIIPRILAGGNYSHLGASFADSRKELSYAEYRIEKTSALSPSFLLGSTITYRLNSRIDMLFNVDYFTTTKVKYKQVTVQAAGGKMVVPDFYSVDNLAFPLLYIDEVVDQRQVLNGLNAGIGLNFKF